MAPIKEKRVAKRKEMLVFARKIAKQIAMKYPNNLDRYNVESLINKLADIEAFAKN